MNFRKYIKNLDIKTTKMNIKAKNPFLENDFAYNPFIGAFEQTYIWVEKTNKNIKKL